MNKKDEELFNEWWKKERGDLVGDEGNYSSVTATEGQLFNWEKQAFLAGAAHYNHLEDKVRELEFQNQRLSELVSFFQNRFLMGNGEDE